MKNKIKYTEGQMGELRVAKDFLPSQDQLVLKDENKRIMGYESNWAEYRKRRNLFLLSIIAFMPVMYATGTFTVSIFKSEAPFMVVGIIYLIAFAIAGNRMIHWRCPRCGIWFFTRKIMPAGYFYNPFVRKCVHCKLPKWAGDDNK
jgi:hypothetical protein